MTKVGYAGLLENQPTVSLGPSAAEQVPKRPFARAVGVKDVEELALHRSGVAVAGGAIDEVTILAHGRGDGAKTVLHGARAELGVETFARGQLARPGRAGAGAEPREALGQAGQRLA